jgi:hypothetical protein
VKKICHQAKDVNSSVKVNDCLSFYEEIIEIQLNHEEFTKNERVLPNI